MAGKSYPSLLQHAESDVEIALAGAAMLDNHLKELLDIALYGTDNQRRSLIERGFTRTLALCVGLITPAEHSDLGHISNIRNRFAHDWPRPHFDHDNIYSIVGNLSTYHDLREIGLNGRAVYVRTVCQLADVLNRRQAAVLRKKAVGR